MAPRQDTRSRIVSWLKIILPMTALGLLSTLFLVSRTIEPSRSIPVSRADLENRTGSQQITSRSFSGLTDEGHALAFVATGARLDPEQAERVLADHLTAQIDMVNGGRINVTSLTGDISDASGVVILTGDVVLTSTTGYRIETQRLDTQLRELAAESDGPISGNGPPGQLEAGKMVMTSDAQTDDVHLVFTNGVKLIYEPDNE